jgi:hypothetical protein
MQTNFSALIGSKARIERQIMMKVLIFFLTISTVFAPFSLAQELTQLTAGTYVEDQMAGPCNELQLYSHGSGKFTLTATEMDCNPRGEVTFTCDGNLCKAPVRNYPSQFHILKILSDTSFTMADTRSNSWELTYKLIRH